MNTHIKTSFLLSHHSLSKIQVLIIFMLLHLPVAAQEAQPQTRQIKIGERTERKLFAEEETHVYSIEMKRGQVLRVNFQEKGADITALVIRAYDQKKVSALTNFGTGFMQESLTVIADQDTVYLLVIRAQRITQPNIEARYEFSTALRNTSSQNDIQRRKAETLMEEGVRLLEGRDKTSCYSAIAKFEESQKIWNLLGESYWADVLKVTIASAFFQAGDFSKTEFYLNQVLKTFTDAKNEPWIATISLTFAGLYVATRNEKAASQYVRKAREISSRLGDKRAESLLGLMGMTPLILETDDRDFARDLASARAKGDKLAEALVWTRTLFHYVIEEDSIADEEQRKFFEKAEREALPLLAAVKNRDIELQIFLGLGVGFYDLTLARGTSEAADLANKKKSINYISHALVLAKVQNNLIFQLLAYTHLNVFYDGDNDRLAIFFGKKTINSLQDLKEDFKIGDKESQQDVATRMDEVYTSVASDLFFEGRLPEAHQVLNLGRDQEFFDFNLTASREPAKLSLTSREMENERLFNGALESIAAKYSKRTDADYQLAGEELKVTLEKLEENFKVPRFERDIAPNVADTVDMQFALRELTSKTGKKHAAIYLVEDVGQVLLITSDGIFSFASNTRVGDLSTHNTSFDIDEDILDFLHTLRSPSLDPRPLGARIYDKIFKTQELVNGKFTQTTLEDRLTRLKPDVLLWSLTGHIRYVPVAALYDANKGKYLAEEYQNTVFTRARKERFLVEPKVWRRGVGFGTSLAYGDYSPLPHVPDELLKIFGNPANKQKGFFGGQVFLNRAFTRQTMVASLQSQPALVHIASHFIFRPGDSRHSFLLLGDGSKFSLLEMQQTRGLFQGVDLLTLSACDTAGQQPGADGREVDGFAEVAQRLGASSVIATLWTIADNGTSQFMAEFYRLWQANPTAPKSEILQQAQLSLLKGKSTTVRRDRTRGPADILGLKETEFKPRAESPLEHPYYWASFVLFGSSR